MIIYSLSHIKLRVFQIIYTCSVSRGAENIFHVIPFFYLSYSSRIVHSVLNKGDLKSNSNKARECDVTQS